MTLHTQTPAKAGQAIQSADYRQPWHIFHIMSEFVKGYQFLSGLKKEVTILGSARFEEGNEHYEKARTLGRLLAEGGFTTITGGGPGIMEAGNRGAHEGNGESIGLNIELPFEQTINPYVTKMLSFDYFFTRKVMLVSPANAFVFCPGGFGTFDEFFEVVDLIELKMMSNHAPIILLGKDFWQPVVDFLCTSCEHVGSVSREFVESWHVVDTPEEAYEIIKEVKDEPQVCELSANSFHCEGKIDWKMFRVMAELVEGFEFVSGVDRAVTVLGTKSIAHESPYYASAVRLGRALAERGCSVVTGGGHGIAEGANKGAFEMGGTSIGVGLHVPGSNHEPNAYMNKQLWFHYPFTRKVILTTPTKGFVFFPGGLGTMHQLFELLTLIQTQKLAPVPIILVDHEFWEPIHHFIKQTMYHDVGTISDKDDELYQIVDTEEAAIKILEEACL